MRKNLLILSVVLLLSQFSVFAYDLEFEGIYYNIVSEGEVAVTYESSDYNSYSGDVLLPVGFTYYDYGSETGIVCVVTAIGEYAFYDCTALDEVLIPENSVITTIGASAFRGCTQMSEIDLPASLVTIEESAFHGCFGLTGITIPDNVTTIGDDAFRSCSALTTATIGEGVTTIGDRAFVYCNVLSELTIGSSVTSIGDYAFASSSELKEIRTNSTTPPSISSNTFSMVDKESCVLYVPQGCKEIYSTTAYWEEFLNIEEDTTGIEEVAIDSDAKEVARYTIDGRQIAAPQKGVNIIRYSDGTVKKVLEK